MEIKVYGKYHINKTIYGVIIVYWAAKNRKNVFVFAASFLDGKLISTGVIIHIIGLMNMSFTAPPHPVVVLKGDRKQS